jgi:hypothetical protein
MSGLSSRAPVLWQLAEAASNKHHERSGAGERNVMLPLTALMKQDSLADR